ncbi:ferric iron reductase [Streptomyces pluripotens]|uniref:Ferric iron reductase n=1 Tax=Streptomyces pluripotens TaxID=1355015 RepID=A0A221NT30_9ACTN|nr:MULTISPECIES: (2Fe-2S)-binding protein [Streptomyces]ARP68886.1 ferric iron reductase [Streptomyces pluripotens]ASN23139.1 ferric iron reductase [Streptomyces pluripotens]KIE25842.1 ferric iron reductase [Streptomyces sp. MUSC 125]MCH0556871.1 (2Fe-2S)-binding protein [Streptomyces sp. MUM 16J]
MDLEPELAALRPLGGFFVLRTCVGASGVARGQELAGLPTLAETYALLTPDAQDNPLASRITMVADRLRTRELRVSASLTQQALAARLWSAALGCAVLYGRLPDLDARLLRWDFRASAPDDLWLTALRPRPADAATLAGIVLHSHLVPLEAGLKSCYGIAAGLLRGNAASALAGAARELERWARAGGLSDVVARTRALTAELFTHPDLRTAGTPTDASVGTAFRRRSCCLYYRVPGGGVCGDCCFIRPPRSSPGAASG